MDNVYSARKGALSEQLAYVGILALCVLLERSEIIVGHKAVIDSLVGNSYLGNVSLVSNSVVDSCIECSFCIGLAAVELVVSGKIVACLLCAGRRIKKVYLVAVSSYNGINIVVGDIMYP